MQLYMGGQLWGDSKATIVYRKESRMGSDKHK